MYTNNGTAEGFSICIQTLPPPPVNLDCATAAEITPAEGPGCGAPVAGSTGGVPAETTYPCYYGAGNSVWYKFTATQETHLLYVSGVETLYGSGYYTVGFYRGDGCGDFAWPSCFQQAQFQYLSNLTVGETYYLQWSSYPNTAHNFQLCIGTAPPPANDECAAAQPVAQPA